jgi:hypothetical protein
LLSKDANLERMKRIYSLFNFNKTVPVDFVRWGYVQVDYWYARIFSKLVILLTCRWKWHDTITPTEWRAGVDIVMKDILPNRNAVINQQYAAKGMRKSFLYLFIGMFTSFISIAGWLNTVGGVLFSLPHNSIARSGTKFTMSVVDVVNHATKIAGMLACDCSLADP